MLTFARGQELRPEPVDLPTLVRGMTDLLQRTLGSIVTVETSAGARRCRGHARLGPRERPLAAGEE